MPQTKRNLEETAVRKVEDGIAEARVAMAHADRRTKAFVKQRPIVAMAAAIGFGYVMARIFSRI